MWQREKRWHGATHTFDADGDGEAQEQMAGPPILLVEKKSLVQIEKTDDGAGDSPHPCQRRRGEPPKPEVVAAQDAAGAAASERGQAAPPPTAAEAPAPSVPPAEAPAIADEEQVYKIQVPPNTEPGSKLKLTIPGMREKVVIMVPSGALPGRMISFSIPKSKEAVQAKLLEQTKAATMLQSRLRGKNARKVTRNRRESREEQQAAAPAAEIEYTPNFNAARQALSTDPQAEHARAWIYWRRLDAIFRNTPTRPAKPVTAAAATPSPLPPPPQPQLVIKGEEPGLWFRLSDFVPVE